MKDARAKQKLAEDKATKAARDLEEQTPSVGNLRKTQRVGAFTK